MPPHCEFDTRSDNDVRLGPSEISEDLSLLCKIVITDLEVDIGRCEIEEASNHGMPFVVRPISGTAARPWALGDTVSIEPLEVSSSARTAIG